MTKIMQMFSGKVDIQKFLSSHQSIKFDWNKVKVKIMNEKKERKRKIEKGLKWIKYVSSWGKQSYLPVMTCSGTLCILSKSTGKLLSQGFRYHKSLKIFYKYKSGANMKGANM